jgi:hypothetical protein
MNALSQVIERQQETMEAVSQSLSIVRATCNAGLQEQLVKPQPSINNQESCSTPASTSTPGTSIPYGSDEFTSASVTEAELNQLVHQYFADSCKLSVTFWETVLETVLAEKTEAATHEVTVETHQATAHKAREIFAQLVSQDQLESLAYSAMENAIRKAEHLTETFMDRKRDAITEPSLNAKERSHQLNRLEADALQYLYRQLLSQLRQQKNAANFELRDALAAVFQESLEQPKFTKSVDQWAKALLKPTTTKRPWRIVRKLTANTKHVANNKRQYDEQTIYPTMSTQESSRNDSESNEDANYCVGDEEADNTVSTQESSRNDSESDEDAYYCVGEEEAYFVVNV